VRRGLDLQPSGRPAQSRPRLRFLLEGEDRCVQARGCSGPGPGQEAVPPQVQGVNDTPVHMIRVGYYECYGIFVLYVQMGYVCMMRSRPRS
jgi:hypothetical protein